MSQENVEVVKRVIAAVNDRNIDGYLACCTNDIRLQTPMADIEGAYEGPDGIRRFFADIEDAGPDFRIHLERVEPIDHHRVMAFVRTSATGRASGIPYPAATGVATTNLYDFVNGKIRHVRVFLDRREALEAAGQTP